MESFKSFFGLGPKEEPACYHIYGYLGCPYFQKAMCLGNELEKNSDPSKVKVNITVTARHTWRADLKDIADKHNAEANGHETCPIVLEGCGQRAKVVGGYSEFTELAAKRHRFRSTRCENK